MKNSSILLSHCYSKSSPQARGCRANAGYTLLEILIAVSIFGVAAQIAYEVMVSNTVLAAKNTGLNKSNAELQSAYYKLLSGLEDSAAFVDCANYDATSGNFTAVAQDSWGNSVRFLRLVPLTGYVLPADGSGYTVSNPPPVTRQVYYAGGSTTVTISYNPALYSGANLPTGIRLYATFPSVSETVSGGKSPGVKPGLGVSSISASGTQKLVLTMNSTLPANTILDCNRVYLVVESAFAVTTDASDGHKTLLYIANTSSTAAPVVISTNLDAGNHDLPDPNPSMTPAMAVDSTIPNNGTSGTFSMNTAIDTLKVLLPIRDQQFNKTISRFGSGATNTGFISITPKFRERQQL